MNSKKIDGNSLDKGKSPQNGTSSAVGFGNNSPKVDQLSCDVADISLESTEDGNWEVFAKKSKNRSGTGAGKSWGSQGSAPKAWGSADTIHKLGMASNGGTGWASKGGSGGMGKASGGTWHVQTSDSKRSTGRGNAKPQSSNKNWETAYMAPPPVIPPPLQNGWQWPARSSLQSNASEDVQSKGNTMSKVPGGSAGEDFGHDMGDPHPGDDDDDDADIADDSDDDNFSDEFDSDASQESHETRKKNKWFKIFFESLDNLTVEQINEPQRQWHCPACKNGPGGIDWYRGLQPLMTHAKTKGAKRVLLHRKFAEVLEEELARRGTSVIPSGEAYGKWKGLEKTVADKEIVWPPMVVIMNTRLEKDENDKWIGMGNQELLDYFSSYAAVKARHSYGPQGHRGMSVLIFETSAVGYLEAERLHKHFSDQGTDREAWDRHRVPFLAGGKRQLYGYMACKDDLDIFNQHCQGKTRLKFEMRSYHEMVVEPMKQMSEDNQQLIWYKNKADKERRNNKALKESFGIVSEKLRKTMEENRIVRQRTKMQHEQNNEEMNFQRQFFEDQISIIHQALEEKEKNFEQLLQAEREKFKQSNQNFRNKEEQKLRNAEIARFIQSQEAGIEKFEAEREKLIKAHEDKKAEMKRKHLEEEVEVEREFEAALTGLMEQYTPSGSSSS
ncbi:PREDICTED: protein SUPPRESSOR OF GENE SILENCING 3 [Nelumbo nucifera]|uniref:Protein SUPPRESSOR OF GENE SILENCING 3 n=2 Tax=Nelumbo nucifera TaxID=4432 RepID=A0A1U7ZV82_NELNU|nr:PREDICTED: protein SUPPRESSOR OF GENE SILENCING 3 [Nelumbo nucifera]XP_010252367.1 PREDICTED: protein SUPPRESSOR OF GENE SILENCING 3 [Nelumbo nucifera]XP_010252368.1 PREDICTED: protein SUPPRESSOR OF GENE SILENCING 3 [Nelumbo nucifera]XP_010252369.1 PREDICTED: protein SUPPRESSOR OF GENE SILENCING 3 [Nelumbo nucifera]DAD38867.1 TPA_asm: hypothetical protein HUJ06_013189 [Nelumbo nucifera]